MDKIYYQSRAHLGEYAVRRLPKGSAGDGAAPVPGGGTPLEANPVALSLSWVDTLGPHAETTRVTYVVPEGRRAIIAPATASLQRMTASAGNSVPAWGVVLLLRKGHNLDLYQAVEVVRGAFNNALITGSHNNTNPGPVELFEGDTVLIRSGDTHASGTITYQVTASIVEYDALWNVKSQAIGIFGQGAGEGSAGSSRQMNNAIPYSGYRGPISGSGGQG